MARKLHVKIKKNLYDLSYERHLQKCHAFINLGAGLWLAFVAIMATYILEVSPDLTSGIMLFFSTITAIIFFFTISFYWQSKKKRDEIEEKIKKLNPEAKNL